MGGLAQDVRYAWRAIRRAPVFSAIAIGCLAVGIGVNATAFSVLDALLVRDLPGVERGKQLSAILVSFETEWGRTSPREVALPDWEVFRAGMPGFSSSSVLGFSSVALRLSGGPLAVRADFVSGDYFRMLGTQPAAGRLLTNEDDQPGAPPATVISYALWSNEYGRRQDIIGQPLYLGDQAFTIVGVAPEGFVGLYPGELVADPEQGAPYLFMSLASAPLVRMESRYASRAAALDDNWLVLVGRRRPGVSPTQIDAQAQVASAALAAAYPQERKNAAAVVRAPSTASRAEMMAIFAFVMAIPLLVLLVACANLANQLLARAVQRSREIAVRLSLGATRARLVRLLLVESTLLAVIAGVAGIFLARVLTDALQAFALIVPFRIPMDVRVVLFTIAVALITAVAFGLVPSLRATRLDLAQSIKEGAGSGSYRRSRLRNVLVVTQVAASVALLALAGVFVRGSQRSRMSESEDNVNRVLTVATDLELLGYEASAGLAFQSRVMERLRALPGVEAVALSPVTPQGAIPSDRITLPVDAPDYQRYREVASVSGDWFVARNTRALAGRLFTAAEAQRAAPVAVVDEAAARKFWPEQSALGQTFRLGEGENAVVLTVIGVMPTVRDRHGHNDDGVITVPASGRFDARSYFYVRTRGNAADLRAAAREVIHELDNRLPPAAVATLGESLDELGANAAQLASGVGAMGTIALLLAALGLASVLSFVVAQRRFEIGVRIALGAQAAAVTWMVLRQSLQLAAIGIVVGAVLAGLMATVVRGMLFGLPPIDPVAFIGSTTIILLVALLSSVAPARRAAGVDPLVALKAD